jgi:hypothetical protein
MLILFNTKKDVVAAKFKGRIERNDLARYVDRVEAALESQERVHLFVEIVGFDGVDWHDMEPFLGSWFRMLGKLKHFGRIALVSDTAWLRWAAKLESALLPYISYETFPPEDREIALAWVTGDRDSSRGPAIKIILTTKPEVLGFEIDGKISAEELHAVSIHLNRMLADSEPRRMLGRIKRLEGFDPACVFDSEYLAMKRGMLDRLERYAIVGGPAWLASWVKALDPLFRIDIRHFELKDEAMAWAWLGAEPRQLQSLVA